MSDTGVIGASGRAAPRGRIDKRRAILAAAFAVFAREGYTQAGVDVVAAEAGVAKATVYNHFGDKETLFREAVGAASDAAMAKNLAVLERLDPGGGDLRPMLEDVCLRFTECYCEPDSWALRRLLYTEITQFPDLPDIVQERATGRVTGALIDRLARLSVAGRLRLTDPSVAAEHLTALLTGPMEARARWGTREIPDADMRAATRAAVDTFLKAYGG